MKKKKLWLLLLIPILLFGAFGIKFYWDYKIWEKTEQSIITDPLDPDFDPNEFAFNNYNNNKELAAALKILIKPGMPLQEAEKFLDGSPDKRGGRDMTNIDFFFKSSAFKNVKIDLLRDKAGKVFLYTNGGRNRPYKNPAFVGWKVIVFYDEQDLVIQVIVRNDPLLEEGRL